MNKTATKKTAAKTAAEKIKIDPANPILNDLNDHQLEAVTHQAGPLLIVAGAGTGKTTVITRRLAYLLKTQKLQPENVLALTFTDKAANEMEERVDELLPLGYGEMWIDTFHGFCDRLLRDNALEIGLDPNYQLLNQTDLWLFLRQNLFEFDLDYYRPLGNPSRFLNELIKHFSRAKDEDITPAEYAKFVVKKSKELKKKEDQGEAEEEITKLTEISKAYQTYQDLMVKNGYLDFGDLISLALHLLRKRKTILGKYQKQFQYLLVDEFQDTNVAQNNLLKLLAPPRNNLTVVGDDDQAIYKFRGASVSNILQFKSDFPKAKTIVLTQNYRSTQNILELAYKSIQLNNPDRLEPQQKISKELTSALGKHKPPEHLALKTAEDEAVAVINKIIELKNKDSKLTWSDFAILVRANSSADLFINYLAAKKIPYEFVASKGLYLQPEIIDLISYLRVLNDFSDNISLYRVLANPFYKFKPNELNYFLQISRRKNIPLAELLLNPELIPNLFDETKQKITPFTEMFAKHAELARSKPVAELALAYLNDSGYLKTLEKETELEREKKQLNISLFFKRLTEQKKSGPPRTVTEFMDELELAIEAGEDPAPSQFDEGPDAVKIMTIHSAKGLEFVNVFVVNMVNDRFPVRARRDLLEIPAELVKETLPQGDAHLQEERRLFYVALTRAKKRLFLTSAEDYGGKRMKKPSQFLKEIEPHLSSKKIDDPSAEEAEVKYQADLFSAQPSFNIPARFSYTQLSSFKDCPRKYKFEHIIKIPRKGSHVLSYGISLHSTLQKFYQIIIDQNKIPTENDLLDLLDQSWVPDYYLSKSHERERKEAARAALVDFYAVNKDQFKPPKFVEQSFNLRLGNFAFTGRIDRVDQTPDGLEVIDYKTGKVKSQKEVDKDDQLSLYALALENVFQKRPAKLSLYFLDAGQKVTTIRQPETLAAFQEKLLEAAQKIKKSKFLPTPGFQCQWCDYAGICEARK